MLKNHVKHRLEKGEPAIGIAVGLGAPLAAEFFSLLGFDFILVDNQHGAWDDQSTMFAFRSICLGKAIPMVRVQKNDFYTIGRALDRGAMGIIVPMVNSAKEAEQAAQAVRFPPKGGRSIGPFATAFLGTDYVQEINQEVYLAVQIESISAVEHAEEILSVEGVDGCWVGPGDLSLSMGVDLHTPEGRTAHEEAILHVLEVCRKTGKVPGIAATPQTAKYWLDKGFLFINVGAELTLLQEPAKALLQELKGS
ncbi:MAG: 2-dehydro-3-deoxyglucarate aldolase [Anaerolineae bacterium]|nr:2-dehydro-3-deoxyglucarate aldolase [Anaerolineae bacterium]